MKPGKSSQMIWLVLIFVLYQGRTLFAEPMTAGSVASINLERALSPGDKAPFEGVLVPYPQYYYYNEQVELNFERESSDEESGCDMWTKLGLTAALFFITGFAVGSN